MLLLATALSTATAIAKPPGSNKSVMKSVSLLPISFCPADVENGFTTLRYGLTRAANVSVWVRNDSGTPVRLLQDDVLQPTASYELSWDGAADGGGSLPPGQYAVVASARTEVRTYQTVRMVELLPSPLRDVGVTPAAIYGGADSSASVAYTLSAAATVTVVVEDGDGATVRTLQAASAREPDSYALTWDGRGDGGATLPVGDYTVVVTATTAAGTVQSVAPVALLPSPLGAVSVTPASFYGGAGAGGSTTIGYSLSAAATVTVIVQDGDGATVRTLQAASAKGPGSHTLVWDGTGDGGANLPEGSYTVVITATPVPGVSFGATKTVQYNLTPVASEASLTLNATGRYVLHAVVEEWDETLNGQTAAAYYFDGQVQPWELAATSGATLTLYVGADAADHANTSGGGSVGATTDSRGVADLVFPSGLSWYDQSGDPLPLYYSLRLTYGGSTRWYPASGRYALRPPAAADGHLRFGFVSDIQTPKAGPDIGDPQLPRPSTLTPANGAYAPYIDIPGLSRSLGWAAVLTGVRQESAANLVVYGGDLVDRAADDTAPDDGTTQLRTIFDNEQTFGAGDEWSMSSLAAGVPVVMAAGNHEDIGRASAAAPRWARWAYSPSGQPYYTFDQGDVHFVVLNTYSASTDAATNYTGWIGFQSDTVGGSRTVRVGGKDSTYHNSAQADWLIGTLDTAKPWTVVVMHHALFDAYSTGAYSPANQTGGATSSNKYYYGERDRLLAFFADHGVDVVLQGHNHNYRRHVERVRSGDGAVVSEMTFLTQATSGGPPTAYQRDTSDSGGDYYLPALDWIDLNGNGVPDNGEPPATAQNSDYWDAAWFGQRNSLRSASGYFGITPDEFHATGEEFDSGISFSYSLFQTGSDAHGDPSLTLTVKRVSWSASKNAWNPWTDFETLSLPQVDVGMTADRLTGS